ncbi:MAG: ABC transporter ATP-binding protein [Muricomes sp.]
MSILRVQDLSVQFHDRYAKGETVQGITFAVEPGEIVGIVGESGSGKTTAMQAIMGLLPERAKVRCEKLLIEQEDITPPCYITPGSKEQKAYEKKMSAIRGKQISMIFQDPFTCLNPTVKIGRQITETICVHNPKCSRQKAKERALELLDMAGIRQPLKRMNQYPFELSGGMRQRICIAIALACEPKLLIADEPTTALDATVQGQILQLLSRIARETGVSVLFVSHDLSVISSICSRVIVMQEGRILEEGTVEEIFSEPRQEYTRELIDRASQIQKLSDSVVYQEPLLSVQHISKQYPAKNGWGFWGGTEAVKDVSFLINKGETYGLVGESGCGKTTLAGMIAGVHMPTEGYIQFKAKKLTQMDRRIQMVFQDSYASLNPRMTIRETLEEPLLLNTKFSAAERRRKVAETLNLVGLSLGDAQKYPRAFSGGQRQRIGIARALILEPELIVCDEPVSALDVSTQEQILELLKQIQRERQISTLFISHDLNAVKRISQRIGVMYGGHLVESGGTRNVYEDPWHPYTKTLLSAILTPNPRIARKKRGLWRVEEPRAEESPDTGCPFAHRCGYAMECCHTQELEAYSFEDREIACFLYSREHTGRRNDNYKMISQI